MNFPMHLREMACGGAGGWFVMMLWWIIPVLALVFLFTWGSQQGTKSRNGKSALDILKERYARGEISKKEYEEKKRDVA